MRCAIYCGDTENCSFYSDTCYVSIHAVSVSGHQLLGHRYVAYWTGWLGSRVVSVLDSGAVGPGFKSHPRHCRLTVFGKLFTPTKQRNWEDPS